MRRVVRVRSLAVPVVVFATAGALALTGCSSSSSGGGGGDSSPATNPTTSSDGGGGLGGSETPGGGSQTYTIGFQGVLSTDQKQLGINEEQGYELAIDQANASGNLPFKLKIETSDDQGTAAAAPAAAAKLIQDPSVVGVIGPSFSGPTQAIGAKYASAGLAMISPSATNEDLTSSGFTTFHRIIPTDGVEGVATADYLASKYHSVYVVDDTSAYGKGVADVVRKELGKKNVHVDSQSIAPTSDYSAIAQAVADKGDQAMYYGGYDSQAGLLAKALGAANYDGFRISGNGGKSSVFSSTAGKAGDGYYFACGCLDATTAPAAKAFNDAYQAKWNTPPSTYSPEAYDATNAMIEALKAAADAGQVTRQSVEDQVNKLDYKGITTTVKFQTNGEVAQATVNLYEQKDGKITLLGDIKDQK